MKQEHRFDNLQAFEAKLASLLAAGIAPEAIDIILPYPVLTVEEKLLPATSKERYFSFFGAACGLLGGFAFVVYTVLSWPLVTGGKPAISIPPFVIISFECCILLGGIVSLIGFMLLSGMPTLRGIAEPHEYGNDFVIIVDEKD
jgi:hypothetical protein